jgi:hypothetical protein
MGSKRRIEKAQISYYLPPGYQAEWTLGMLVLRRSDGSVVATLYGQQAIGEVLERYAWEDRTQQKCRRVESAYERFLQLPTLIVLGLLYLAGAMPTSICAAALYGLWLL